MSSSSSNGKETRAAAASSAPHRSPNKDSLQPIVLVEDLPGITNRDSDPETPPTTSSSNLLRRNGTSTTTTSNSFKLEDLLPESGEELLGSVTFAPIRSGPVRTSARVIQKMRQDTRPSTPPTGASMDMQMNDTISSSFPSNCLANSSASGGGSGGLGASVSSATSATSSSSNAVAVISSSTGASTGNKQETGGGKPEKAVAAPRTPTTNQSKQPKRLWSNMERSLFFEALNEYGKDFEAITQHINQKMRRKVFGAETASKSREQIRHLYLQTFQKASRYLRFSEDVKKVPQELYALINYGEMRRKMPFMHEKAFMKLKELVYRGSVTIREKGKTIRIRTPSCRALKKLNQVEEWQEEVTLPQRIEISLVPGTMESWGRVQSLAQNPRIKTTLPLYKRVSCLLKFLQNKWRSQEMRLCEKTMTYQPSSVLNASSSSSNSTGGRSKSNQNNSSKNLHSHRLNPSAHSSSALDNHDLIDELANNEPLLCLAPPAKTIIHRPMVNLTDFSNSYSICLNSYEDRIGAQVRGEELPVEKFLTHKERAMNGKRLRLDSGGEGGGGGKKGAQEKEKKGATNSGLKGESNSDGETSKCASGMDVVQSEEELARPNSPVDIQMFDFSAIAATEDRDDRIDLFSDNSEDKRLTVKSDAETESVTKEAPIGSAGGSSKTAASSKRGSGKSDASVTSKPVNRPASFKPLISEEVIRKIKEGWTVTNCGDLTFGDLYVMFGNDFKINLEYKWVPKEVQAGEVKQGEEAALVKERVEGSAASTSEGESEKEPDVDKEMEQLMGRRLGQLLMIANLMDKSLKKKDCTCDKGGKMKENEHPYPESNLFKHPALPLRYSHYNGYNSMLHLRRQKPRQVYPFPSPKPFMSAPKYYHAGRPTYTRPPLPQLHDEEGQDGDAEDDGDEGPSGTFASKRSNPSEAALKCSEVVEKVPVAVQTVTTEVTSTTITTTTTSTTSREVSMDEEDEDLEEEEEEEEYLDDGEEDPGDYSKNPGLLSLLEISLPSIREDELLRAATAEPNRQGWLEDNMNDYSFSSLLGHIDMHLNSAAQEAAAAAAEGGGDSGGENKDSENGSTGGEEESPEKRPRSIIIGGGEGSSGISTGTGPTHGTLSSLGVNGLRNDGLISDRCSVISESSVDFVKKFAEMAGMIQDH